MRAPNQPHAKHERNTACLLVPFPQPTPLEAGMEEGKVDDAIDQLPKTMRSINCQVCISFTASSAVHQKRREYPPGLHVLHATCFMLHGRYVGGAPCFSSLMLQCHVMSELRQAKVCVCSRLKNDYDVDRPRCVRPATPNAQGKNSGPVCLLLRPPYLQSLAVALQ